MVITRFHGASGWRRKTSIIVSMMYKELPASKKKNNSEQFYKFVQ